MRRRRENHHFVLHARNHLQIVERVGDERLQLGEFGLVYLDDGVVNRHNLIADLGKDGVRLQNEIVSRVQRQSRAYVLHVHLQFRGVVGHRCIQQLLYVLRRRVKGDSTSI